MATISAKDFAKIEADKKATIAAKEKGKEQAYQTQLRQAPEGYRNNPQFQAALRDVVYKVADSGNTNAIIPLKEKLNAIVSQLDPYPSSKKTNNPELKQAYGNAYANKTTGSLSGNEAGTLDALSTKLGYDQDFAQQLKGDIIGRPNTSGGGMGFFSSITKPFANAVKGVGSALGVEAVTDPIANVITNPTLKNFTSNIPFARGLDEGIKQVGDGLKIAGLVAIGGALAGAGGAGVAGASAAGAGAGGTVLGSQTLGSLASSLGLSGAVNAAPSVLSSLGLSGAGTAAGTAAGGASPYIFGSAVGVPASFAGTAVGGAAPTLLGSSTLAELAGSLGLGKLVEAAPNVLGSLGLSGGGSTALGNGVLSNLLGGGGQAGGSSGLFGTGLSLQDLLVGGGTAAGTYAAQEAAKKASEQQAQAAQQGIDIVRGAADRGINTLQTSSDKAATFQQPFYSAGQNALTRLQKILGLGGQAPDFTEITNNPAYQFRLKQGNNAVQNSAANAGNLFSGQTGKAITDYSQSLASTEYQNIINNLSNEAGRGQNAGNQLSNIFQNTGVNQSNVGIQTGGAIADLLRTKGDAVASGTVGRTNAITGGVENLTNYLTRPVQYA